MAFQDGFLAFYGIVLEIMLICAEVKCKVFLGFGKVSLFTKFTNIVNKILLKTDPDFKGLEVRLNEQISKIEKS